MLSDPLGEALIPLQGEMFNGYVHWICYLDMLNMDMLVSHCETIPRLCGGLPPSL